MRVGSAAGPITESFDAATSTRISLSGSAVTVNPTSNLAPNTRYFLTFPAGSLVDTAGNPFAGTSTYDFRTINAVSGSSTNDILSFTSTVDRLTGLAGGDTFRLTSLSHALLPTAAGTAIDRISDLVTGLDGIDAPVARALAAAVNPVALGSVAELSPAAIAALLTTTSFTALTTTSSGGAATFSFADPVAGTRTFLAINDGVAGFFAATDSILEITGFSGSLSALQVF
ncbi:Ig-like domain-containing protein [Cyanobium sp. Morenito 9A2]|nr:Ig-like domain-containing protein [Cyanobium sp. Morenito 9A2]